MDIIENNIKPTSTSINLTLKRDVLQTWFNILCDFTTKSIDEQEKLLKSINELLIELIKQNFFKQDSIEREVDRYFISTFLPKLIKTILTEYINDSYI